MSNSCQVSCQLSSKRRAPGPPAAQRHLAAVSEGEALAGDELTNHFGDEYFAALRLRSGAGRKDD